MTIDNLFTVSFFNGGCMKYAMLVLMLLVSINLHILAQAPSPNWLRTADGHGDQDNLSSMIVDPSGNVYVTGWTKRTSTEDDYLTIKYQQDGTRKNVDLYDPGTEDRANFISYNVGSVAITGKSKQSNYFKIVTAKFDTNNLSNTWRKTLSTSSQHDEGVVTKIGDDNYVFVGGNYASTAANPKIVIISYNSTGTSEANSVIDLNATGTDYIWDMVLGANDTIYFVGSNLPSSGLSTLYVYKLDRNFNLKWSKSFSNVNAPTSYNYKPQIRIDTSRHVYVSYYEYYSSNNNATTVILDTWDGTTVDTRREIGREPKDLVVKNDDQSFYVLSGTGTGPNIKIKPIKFSKSGSVWVKSWSPTFGTDGYNYMGEKIRVDNSGNVYFGGTTRFDQTEYTDFVLAKYNSSGTVQWSTLFDAPLGGGANVLTSMATDNSGKITLGGNSNMSLFVTTDKRWDLTLTQYDVGGAFVYASDPAYTPNVANDAQLGDIFKTVINYPNPFNPATTISFTLQRDGRISVKIYDILGQELSTLINTESFIAGSHEIRFDAGGYGSGSYFYKIIDHDQNISQVRKMILMK